MAHRILMLGEPGGPADSIAGRLAEGGFVVERVAGPAAAVDRLVAEPRPLVIACSSAAAAAERCSAVRWAAERPILVIVPCASAGEVAAVIEAGADSVLSAGIDRRELAARVRASCRTRAPRCDRGRSAPAPAYRAGEIAVDERRHAVTAGGRRLSFTPTEFRLLAALARRAGRTASHDELIDEVWGADAPQGEKLLRLYVGYLRRKLDAADGRGAALVNQRGVGYRLGEAAAS